MRKVVLLAISLAVSCMKASAVTCEDGRTCPAGTTCDDQRSLCLSAAQTTACASIANGQPCDAAGTPGICDRGYCEPGCGDGHTDPDEECDDGNFASHDGCSSGCLVEVPTWIEQHSEWRGLTYQAAVYHEALQRIVVFGGYDASGPSDAIWQVDLSKAETIDGGWHNVTAAFSASERPATRRGAAVAYDPVRQVMVIFGGDNRLGEVYDETWEYAAGGGTFGDEPIGVWRESTSAMSPSPMFAATMAFDPTLQKIVLYGFAATGAETWTYDGQWTQLVTTMQPEVFRAAMAVDEARQRVVLHAGGDTYELVDGDWTLPAQATKPPPRTGEMLAYDPGLQKLVMFGGQRVTPDGTLAVLADTWVYDGAWAALATPFAPPGRRTGRLVTDPVNDRVWLFGGSTVDGDEPFSDEWELVNGTWLAHTPRFTPPTSTGALTAYSRDSHELVVMGDNGSGNTAGNEVWSLDGAQWRQAPDAPTARLGAGLAYDPDHRRFVLTGGACRTLPDPECADPSGYALSTYAFDVDTRTWTQLGATWPLTSARVNAGVVYDRAAHRLVVFGGDDSSSEPIAETWVGDGTTWTELVSAEHPAPMRFPTMTFDLERGSTILFDSEGDTWELRGDEWTKLIDHATATADEPQPAPRFAASMTYDPARRRHVLVAGNRSDGTPLDDVWELDTATARWTQVFVAGTTPLPRHNFTLGHHDNLRATIFYGGSAGALFARNDVWLLRYLSTTPDEVCTGTEDIDQDGQPPALDPDCDPPP